MKKLIIAGIIFSILFCASQALAQEDYKMVLKWGSTGSGDGQFRMPYDVAVDPSGNVYVLDTGNIRIQKFTSNGAFITKWGNLGLPTTKLTIDPSGNVYAVDSVNNRIQEFTSNGAFITKWGSYGSGNGQFNYPFGIAIDSLGYVYVTDSRNNRIQKFTSNGAFVTKWASQFQYPYAIAVDPSGYVYVTDSIGHVQKFTSDGIFIKQWGWFYYPSGIAVDSSGNVYVADTFNYCIQKFTSNGVLITRWGTIGHGDGQLQEPFGVAVDHSGNVYVADRGNNRIQKFALLSDSAPPTTTISLSGTQGKNNWYTSNVTVTLDAVDEGTPPCGVDKTYYSLGEFDPNDPTFTKLLYYVYDLNNPPVIQLEGTTTIYYYSVDKDGNREADKSAAINIDKMPPIVSITVTPATIWPPNNKKVSVKIDGSATDAVSGLASKSFTFTDKYNEVTASIADFGQSINVIASRNGKDKDGRTYTISVIAEDNAGWTATSSAEILVPHDMRK